MTHEERVVFVYDGMRHYHNARRDKQHNCKSCKTPMAEANNGYKNNCHDCWTKLEGWEQ